MGIITVTWDKAEIVADIRGKAENISTMFTGAVDDIADTYQNNMEAITPVRTGELVGMTTTDIDGPYDRTIWSNVPQWDWIILGRGEIFPVTKKALFWPGLDHPVMHASATQPNDYPAEAFSGSEGAVDSRLDQFTSWIVE